MKLIYRPRKYEHEPRMDIRLRADHQKVNTRLRRQMYLLNIP